MTCVLGDSKVALNMQQASMFDELLHCVQVKTANL